MDAKLRPSHTLVDERRNVTESGGFYLQPESGGFHVSGPGMIDTILVRAEDPDYRIRVETDTAVVLRDDWDTLETLSADLSHVSAYNDDGRYVTVIEDYPYTEYSTVEITPTESITFERIRGEWIIGLPVSH